jgi:hypothetical protein
VKGIVKGKRRKRRSWEKGRGKVERKDNVK